jgi:hypothetical protein
MKRLFILGAALLLSIASVAGAQDIPAKLAQIVGTRGEQTGAVYTITIGRDDLKLTEMARRSMRA